VEDVSGKPRYYLVPTLGSHVKVGFDISKHL
jgi:hypothetical protein